MGIGAINEDYPLFADAINEYGLYFAGLRFSNTCKYHKENNSEINLAPYELCLYLLGTCKNLDEVKNKMEKINIVDINFSKNVLNTPLHFMIGDKTGSLCIESTSDGVLVHLNEFQVLTNNPRFEYHKENIKNYMNLHVGSLINTVNKDIDLKHYSYGSGAMFLPGDYSSSSRFVKAFFVKSNEEFKNDRLFNVIQFFNCLDSVKMPLGCVKTSNGLEYTRYSNCYDLINKELYYRTYFCSEVTKVSLKKFESDSDKLQSLKFNQNYVVISDN